MVSTRNKDYGEPPPPKKRPPPRATSEDEPKETPVDKQPEVLCSKFELFPRLPCGMRLMIWEASMAPQILVVRPRKVRPSRSPDSRKIIPAQLSVNMESRKCALRRYSLRFTMTLTVDVTGHWRRECRSFNGITYRANVVMSPDDTLGLQGWESLDLGRRYWFDVEDAILVNCFGTQRPIQPRGTQPEVKSVAFLPPGTGMIHVLNSSVSCDMNSLLHGKPSQTTKHYPPGGSWHVPHLAPQGQMEPFWIYSSNFNGTLQEWGETLLHSIHRVRHKRRFCWIAPHIMAFTLGKDPEEIACPAKLVQKCREAPEGFYLSCEWGWFQIHPCLQNL